MEMMGVIPLEKVNILNHQLQQYVDVYQNLSN
jgi:hypothetical protein